MTVLRAVVFGLITIAVVRMALTLFEDLQQAPVQTVGLLILTLLFLPNLKNRPYILLMIGAVFGILFF
jgi:chromate transport protein ChrA